MVALLQMPMHSIDVVQILSEVHTCLATQDDERVLLVTDHQMCSLLGTDPLRQLLANSWLFSASYFSQMFQRNIEAT